MARPTGVRIHQPLQQQIVEEIQSFCRHIIHLRARDDDMIARNRYRVLGRTDMCAVPDARLRARLME